MGVAPMAPATLGFLASSIASGEGLWPSGPGELAAAAYLAYACTGLAYYLYARGVRVVEAPRAGILSLVEPATAYVLSVLVLGEEAGPVKTLGAVLVLSSAALVLWRPHQARAGI